MPRRVPSLIALAGAAAVAVLPPAAAGAEAADSVRARYTKYEYRIPMRDGVKLFTSVYVPKDAGPDRRYPILLNRTPYGVAPYGSDAYPRQRRPLGGGGEGGVHLRLPGRAGPLHVRGPVRGRAALHPGQGSEGRGRVERHLGHDRLAGQAACAATTGRSGSGASRTRASTPRWRRSTPTRRSSPSRPRRPIADWFIGDDFHHNGAFFLPHAFNFYTSFGQPRPEPTTKWAPRFDHGTADGYEFFLRAGPMPSFDRRYLKGEVAFWKEVMAHESYDAFWQARNTRPHLKGIRPAVLTVGGWFDAEDLFGALETYRSIEAQSPGIANRLVMGPWPHGGWSRGTGEAPRQAWRFGQPTSTFFQEQIELPFFRYYLKGGDDPKLARGVRVRDGSRTPGTLSTRGRRATRSRSPSTSPAQGRLSKEPPAETAEAFDEYVSDPAKPVPFIEDVDIGMEREYMVEDQRFAARRPDVLVYQTEPLEEDLTIAGPITAEPQRLDHRAPTPTGW